jgi:hypothetical protein
MEFLTQLPIPSDVTRIISLYIHLLNKKPAHNLNLIWELPDAYRSLFLRVDFKKRQYDFHHAADLMLSAFNKKQLGVAVEMIDCIFSHDFASNSSVGKFIDNACKLFKKLLREPNTFFDPSVENCYIIIFRRALFDVALRTDRITTLRTDRTVALRTDRTATLNRIAALKLMYRDISDMQKGELLCHFYNNFNLETDPALVAFDGDMQTITYIFEHCEYYYDMMTRLDTFYPIFIGALYSGNIALSNWFIANRKIQIRTRVPMYLPKLLFRCLLRCNHLEKARGLLATDSNRILIGLAMGMVFYTEFDSDFPIPKIELETYEYCLQLFRTPEEKEIAHYKNIFSDEIIIKYFG